jgi:hypothetical protein
MRIWKSKCRLISERSNTAIIIFACFSDYKPNEQLDRYDDVGIDDEDQGDVRYEDRMNAEREMNKRDRMQNKGNHRMADAFADESGEFSENDGMRRQLRLAQMNEEMQDDGN